MKKILQAIAGLLLLLLLGVVVLRTIPIHVYDGFEASRLSWRRWSSWRYVRGAVAMEYANVRAGKGALAITVHSGDRHEAASDTGAATERDELMEAWWLFARTGRSYVYSFSLYLPKDIPQTSERLVIAQWRQLCEARRCRPDYPVLAIRLRNARLVMTRRDEQGSEVLYQGSEDVRGRWLDFRFVTKFDDKYGSVEATLDGQPIVHYRGPTVYQPGPGYPARGLVYFKTGLYRDALGEPPWTMYVDEYRKDECPESGCF
jgi:Polysaccharide lyase